VVTVRTGTSGPITICLVADEEVIERFPGLVRYLQIGLLDEPVEFVLVAPDHDRAEQLVAGSTKLVRYGRSAAIFRRFWQRGIVSDARNALMKVNRSNAVIVHSLSLSSAPLAAQIAQAATADLIVNITSRSALQDPHLSRYLGQAKELIAPARVIADTIRRSPLENKSVETVPFGLAAADAAAAFRVPDQAPALIAAGPLEAESGYDVLLRALGQVVRIRPDTVAFVIGKGNAESDLRALAKSLGLTPSVTFTGRLQGIRSAFNAADIFCIPKAMPDFREEPLLALAAGMLLITAEHELFDGLADRQNARIVASDDVTALADAILDAIKNPETARRTAEAGLKYIRTHHTISGMVARYQAIYERIAAPTRTFRIGSA
jgi:glycosyltransferase involved in cell wall biosynthesis